MLSEYRKRRRSEERVNFVAMALMVILCFAILVILTNRYPVFGSPKTTYAIIILSLVPMVFGIQYAHGVFGRYRRKRWPTVRCTILKSFAQKAQKKGDPEHFPCVFYSYSVLGIEYISDALLYDGRTFRTQADVLRCLQRYTGGTRHDCRYDPHHHQDAVLELNTSSCAS